MAIINTPVSAGLRLLVQTGVDEQGNPIIRSRSFNRVKPSALDQAVYNAAVAIGELQLYPVTAVRKLAEVDLIEG